MAYMSQEHKRKIAKLLKDVVPKSWKYSLAVRHHSNIVMTISKANVDLTNGKDYIDVNQYYLEKHFEGKILEIMKNITNTLNLNNYDRSDIQTDYFDVGHYVTITIGKWDKPFILV